MTRCKYRNDYHRCIRSATETTGRSGVTQIPSPSRIVLLLKLAYNGCALKFSSKEGWNYVDEKEKWRNCVPLAVRRRVRKLHHPLTQELRTQDLGNRYNVFQAYLIMKAGCWVHIW